MRITARQIEAAYDISSEVIDGKMSPEAGARTLRDEFGLNVNSARDFINDFRRMLRGQVFHRAMSAPATDYFLTRIAQERDLRALEHALGAIRKHITYYENLRKISLRALRSVVERHQMRVAGSELLDSLDDETFAKAVQKSIESPSAKRLARLRDAAKRPLRVKVSTFVFVRNPDVVAEVLIRARGSCERCGATAPFLRRRNGVPYLEVHHVTRLVDGGEDTVENAIALCPNCHRELHYG